MARQWLRAWLLAAIAFGGASLIAPLYLVELGGTAFDLGILFAASSFVGVPGALVFGTLADRTGKRRVFVLAAMAITVVTMLAMPALESRWLVIVVYALLWLGFAAATPVLTLLVVTGEPEHEWSALIARLNKFQGTGWALGLFVGFLVVTGGEAVLDTITAQRIFFVVCAGSAGLGFLLAARTLPPDPAPGDEPSPRRLRRRARSALVFNIRGAAFPFTPGRFDVRQLHPRRFTERFTPQLALYFVAVLLVFTGFGAFFAPLPAYLGEIGYGSSEIFALYLVLNVGAAVFFGRVATLVRTYDVLPVHLGGIVIRGALFPLVAAIGVAAGGTALGLGMVGLVFVAIGLTWAVIAVTAATLVTTLSPVIIRGEALGIYGALVAVGGGVGGLLGGALASFGFTVTFGAAGALVLVGAGVVAVLRRRVHIPTLADRGAAEEQL